MPPLQYKEIAPDLRLSSYVKRFWSVSNISAYEQRVTILPDGYFDLVGIASGKPMEEVILAGIYTSEFEVSIAGNTTLFGISFYPLASEYLLQLPIAGAVNRHVALPGDLCATQNIGSKDFGEWAGNCELRLVGEINGREINARKLQLFQLLRETNGTLSVKELAEKLHWNARSLNRYFRSRFGLSLKAYANVLRCKAAYADLRKGKLYPDIAFADQPHFIKEIKKHTGATPKMLYQNKNDRFIQFSTRTD